MTFRPNYLGHKATMPQAPLCQLPPAADMALVWLLVRVVPILLQKSAIRAARPLPRLLGTVLTIRPLMSNDALKGHRPVSRTTQDMHRRLAAVEQPASKAGVNSARLQQG